MPCLLFAFILYHILSENATPFLKIVRKIIIIKQTEGIKLLKLTKNIGLVEAVTAAVPNNSHIIFMMPADNAAAAALAARNGLSEKRPPTMTAVCITTHTPPKAPAAAMSGSSL